MFLVSCSLSLCVCIQNLLCECFSVGSQLASAQMKRRLSVINLSLENNLPMFQSSGTFALEHSVEMSASYFSELKSIAYSSSSCLFCKFDVL